MAFEDADWCLRCWQAGLRIVYQPYSELTHLESVTRGMEQGERELASKDLFWSRWGDFFDRRDVRTDDGKLRIVYVTWDTGVGGGHRDIFEHLNRLIERGHEAELWTRRAGPPDWFDLRAPVRSFDSFDELAEALEPLKAIKVATWWATGPAVWLASCAQRHPRLLRAGHRDLVLPRPPRLRLPRGRHLPARVPLPDHLGVEPRAPGRVRRAAHGSCRPGSTWTSSASATTSPATTAACWSSAATTR